MPPTVYTTSELAAVVANMKRPSTALLDRYFDAEVSFDTENVIVDVEKGGRTIAPFVAPHVPARPQSPQGQQTNTLIPAYIKELSEFRPGGQLSRDLGEQVGGEFSPEERANRRLIRELGTKIDRINRRLEVMAATALRTGKNTIVGKDYPSREVDYLRDAALTPTALATGARWTETTSVPLDNLQDWADLVQDKSGTTPLDVIMGVNAWKSFRNHAKVEKKLEIRNNRGASMDLGAMLGEGLSFRGTIDGFNIFTYGGSYTDPISGATVQIWPKNWVTLSSPGEGGVAGRRLFGAIQDFDSGITPMAYFPKMWVEKNPSALMLLVQSAPLVAPLRPDATLGVQVQDA